MARPRSGRGRLHVAVSRGEKNGASPHILECHSPIMNLLERYPIIGRLEETMFEAVLGTRIRREETRNSGLYECAFYFAA